MNYTIASDKLTLTIASFGAELKSVVNNETKEEYMWQADPAFWGRTSPVLFPFVGSLKDKQYIYDGEAYPMGQHGFARDNEHEMVEKKDDEIWFSFKGNDETKKKYPFEYELKIGYKVIGNKLKVMWRVLNEGEEVLNFSIGAHPAFNCPIAGNGEGSDNGAGEGAAKTKRGNYFKLNTNADAMEYKLLDTSVGLEAPESYSQELQDGKFEITDTMFDVDAFVVEGKQASEVSIVNADGREYVKVSFDAPLFGLWSPAGKNAPFVCIEPWYGRCDKVDFQGELADREYSNALASGEVFEAGYEIEFN